MSNIPGREQSQVGTSAHAIFVAPAGLLKKWNSHVRPSGRLIAFSDADLARAVDTILRHQPKVVVVERSVLATTPGQGFVRRLQLDRRLPGLEMRGIAGDRIDAMLDSRDTAPRAEVLVVEGAEALRPALKRRAVRTAVPVGIELLVDGRATMLVDLSDSGAQVIAPVMLRPQQRVRLTLPQDASRLSAQVVWSAFELPKSGTLPTFYDQNLLAERAHHDTLMAFATSHFRVGLQFVITNPKAFEEFRNLIRKLSHDLGG